MPIALNLEYEREVSLISKLAKLKAYSEIEA